MLALVRVFLRSSWMDPRFVGILIQLVRGRARATVCLWLCFLCEYEESFGIASEGATY